MTKVSLRVYNREIEGLIEGSQLEEAIAHCQHILKTFPMYIETYRLLGKTFLEARKYGDAADIFQRALMAVPDDFVSHVGMSIIRDDEGKLDEAIWHMERAFEIQPSNSAIQSELRRLYGRRDGVEPPKIRLSRDALANMYSQGELFNQAIAEIRAVLADDPNRPDLQVMLARAYFRAGQKVEAAEMAATLLKKFPYCLDALRVLVDVLPGTTQGENTQIYRHRLGMLDPYSAFAKDSMFASDQVGDSAISIERLEYKPGAAAASAEPDWASSLGIRLEGEKRAESAPEWLQPPSGTLEPPGSTPELAVVPPGEKNDNVPDWMRSAGWQESSGAPEGTLPEEPEVEAPAEPASQADIPDWVKSMAPAGLANTEGIANDSGAELPPIAEGEVPDWLKSMAPSGIEPKADGAQPVESVGATLPPANVEPPAAEEEGVPDWLKSLAPTISGAGGNGESQSVPAEPAPVIEPVVPPSEADIPDWLKAASVPDSVEAEKIESQPAPAEPFPIEAAPVASIEPEMPEWIRTSPSAAETENIVSQPVPSEIISGEERPAASEEIEMPDWLKAAVPPSGDEPEAAAPADMEMAAPSADIVSEENNVNIPAEAAAIPDWLKSMAPPTPAEPENIEMPVEPAAPPTQEVPPVAQVSPTAAEPNVEADFPDWLKSLGQASAEQVESAENVREGFEPAAMDFKPEQAGEEAFPDWLNSLEPEAEKQTELEDTRPTQAVSLPTGTEPEPSEAVVLPDWLTGLGDNEQPQAVAQTEGAQPVIPEVEPMHPAAEQPVSDVVEAAGPPPLETVSPESGAPTPVPIRSSDDESFIPSGTVKPLEIGDDALGWLESLAAKQGANPEELLTKPEERETQFPQALQSVAPVPADVAPEPGEAGIPAELSTSEDMIGELPKAPLETLPLPSLDAYIKKDAEKQPLQTLPLSPLDILGEEAPSASKSSVEEIPQGEMAGQVEPPAEAAPAQPVKIEDDTMAWLEGLAANQGAKPEELLTKPEDRPQATPEWVKSTAGEEPIASMELPPQAEVEKSAPEKPESVQEHIEEDITVTTWLSNLETEEAGVKPVPEGTPSIEAQTPQEELPDWLRDMEKMPAPESPKEPREAESDLPDWLRTPAEPPAEVKAEEPPVLEPIPQPEAEEPMPAWMEEPEKAAGQAAPTEPDEWLPMEEVATGPGAPTAREVVQEPVIDSSLMIEPTAEEKPVEPTAPAEVNLAPVPVHDKDASSLAAAQAALEKGSLQEALREYARLIKKGRLLDEVIHDLREATYRFPVDVILWQALGDAYMRTNRLQDALDAYTKAEELLR